LTVIREAIGSPQPSPEDLLREDEMAVVPFLELQVSADRHRVPAPRLRREHPPDGRGRGLVVELPSGRAGDLGRQGPGRDPQRRVADRITPLAEHAVLGLYHAQQARAWTATFIEGLEVAMANAGIHSRLERPPAICFLDITGYTRLTQEHGDEAAADLATTLARLVQRRSVHYGGKPIKWLGDGVMFYFRDPGPGVRAALEMVGELAGAGLPPAHVGLHTGPVLYQQGDYFGQTVNLAARIADYARPGEVLVSKPSQTCRRTTGSRSGTSARRNSRGCPDRCTC
jgi:class 3 adenylate cyclase